MLTFKGFFEKKDDEIIGVASTQSPDRDGEVILQNGWELDNFRANPVILAGHDYWSFPIGKATDIMVEGTRLIFKMVFASSQKGQEALQLVKEGVLNTFSVGFIPKEWSDGDTVSRAELLEISLVSVPANAEAVVLAKGMKDNSIAKHFSDDWMKNKEIKEAMLEKLNEEVEVTKTGDTIECECGKTYTLKLAPQSDETPAPPMPPEENQGEEGEGREEDPQENAKALVKGALKLLQRFQEVQNRKEDRKI